MRAPSTATVYTEEVAWLAVRVYGVSLLPHGLGKRRAVRMLAGEIKAVEATGWHLAPLWRQLARRGGALALAAAAVLTAFQAPSLTAEVRPPSVVRAAEAPPLDRVTPTSLTLTPSLGERLRARTAPVDRSRPASG